MDYRSIDSKITTLQFAAGVYDGVAGNNGNMGFVHRDTSEFYGRTTSGKVVHIVGEPEDGLTASVLSEDRTTFEAWDVDTLTIQSSLDRDHLFTRDDLIPAQTFYEFARDVAAPKAAGLAASVIVGNAVGAGFVCLAFGTAALSATNLALSAFLGIAANTDRDVARYQRHLDINAALERDIAQHNQRIHAPQGQRLQHWASIAPPPPPPA